MSVTAANPTAIPTPATATSPQPQTAGPATVITAVSHAPSAGKKVLRWAGFGMLFTIAVVGGVCAGLLLVKHNPGRAALMGFVGPQVRVVSHPNPNPALDRVGLDLVIEQIKRAQKSVTVLAGKLTSQHAVKALLDQHKAGVDVVIILPAPAEKAIPLLRHLRSNGYDKAVVHRLNFDEQMVLIDDRLAIIGTLPWGAAAVKEMAGSVIVTTDRASVKEIRDYMALRFRESTYITP